MKNKKIVIYLGILALGILLGWGLFGGSSSEEHHHEKENGATKEKQLWTCSMHPQIMQPEPGDCPICGMDLIPADAGADGLTSDQFKLTANAMALANVQTTVIEGSGVNEQQLTLSGKIVPNENAEAVQASYFTGRIERLNISATGEVVNKGQLLATIYAPELYAAQQELITAASLKESQPALYKAVRNKLKLWKLSEQQINNIEKTKKVQEFVPIYATVSGTVTEKLVTQGDYVKQGQPLLKIANLSSVWASFDIYESQIGILKKGQEVVITTNAYPNKTFTGKVDFIDPVLNNKTRTVSLRVVLNNKEAIFKPGMFVKAAVALDVNFNKKQSLVIPASAVLWTGKRSVVYLKVQPDEPVFEMREVVLGSKLGENYEVLDGVFSGNEIVTNGAFTVDAAAQLQGKRSMMNKKENDTTKEAIKEEVLTQTVLNSPEQFKKQLNALYKAYLPLKDALVSDDFSSAKSKVATLTNALTKIDMKLLKQDDAHMKWMQYHKELEIAIDELTTAENIMDFRTAFKPMSEALVKTIQVFGITDTAYIQYCPMADNDKGGYWISNEEQIRNPYFGDMMLKCGEVKKVLEQ